MIFIVLWIILSMVVGYVATQKKRSFVGFLFLSLLLTPLVSLLVLIAIPAQALEHSNLSTRGKTQTCPFCAETIKSEAIKCKHCGSTIEKESCQKVVISEEKKEPTREMVTVTCPGCAIEDSTPYPMNTKYYKKFDAKQQVFSSALRLACKECGHEFEYDW